MARPHTGAASETMAMWVSRRLRSIGSRLVAINADVATDRVPIARYLATSRDIPAGLDRAR